MITPTPAADLEDDASLQAADREGILRSAASAGAQVRATATALSEGALASLRGLRPRSVVVVPGSGRAGRAAALVSAAVGEHLATPVTTVPGLPPWTGPLDVVLVAGDDPADPRLVEAVEAAVHRGAEVIVAAPAEGPMQTVAAGRAQILEPRIPVLPPHRMLRYLAVLVGLLATLESAGGHELLPDLQQLADDLDAEALRDAPAGEIFHNPAKSLAIRLEGTEAVLTGDTPAATELARHGAEVLLSVTAHPATAVGLPEAAAAAPRLISAAQQATGDFDPLFHDEQLDGPPPRHKRIFLFSATTDEATARRKLAIFTAEGALDTELVHLDEAPTSTEGLPPQSRPTGILARLAILTLRWEMATAYLHLVDNEGRH